MLLNSIFSSERDSNPSLTYLCQLFREKTGGGGGMLRSVSILNQYGHMRAKRKVWLKLFYCIERHLGWKKKIILT